MMHGLIKFKFMCEFKNIFY